MSSQKGFTLIEMVLVVIIMSIASVPLFGLFSQAASSLLVNEKTQTAVQLAQEHAEYLLAIRRNRPLQTGSQTLAVISTSLFFSFFPPVLS